MSFAAPAVRLAGSASTLVTALSAAFPIALLLAPCGTHAQESAAAKDAPLPSVVVTGLPVCATSATWPYYPVGYYLPHGRQGWVELEHRFGG